MGPGCDWDLFSCDHEASLEPTARVDWIRQKINHHVTNTISSCVVTTISATISMHTVSQNVLFGHFLHLLPLQNIEKNLTYIQIAEIFLFTRILKWSDRELLIYTSFHAKYHPGIGPSTNIKPETLWKKLRASRCVNMSFMRLYSSINSLRGTVGTGVS